MKHWFRSCALVIGTALGLSLAGAPPAARSAQADNQPAVEAGQVIDRVAINSVTTMLTCTGPACACATGEVAVGGGARCSPRDTLQDSFPATAFVGWQAMCVRMLEIRRPAVVQVPGAAGPGISESVVIDIQRFPIPPATTYVVCSAQ